MANGSMTLTLEVLNTGFSLCESQVAKLSRNHKQICLEFIFLESGISYLHTRGECLCHVVEWSALAFSSSPLSNQCSRLSSPMAGEESDDLI